MAKLFFSVIAFFALIGAVMAQSADTAHLKRGVAATVWIITDVGFGSGFVVSSDGVIVTNRHVVEGSAEIAVLVNNRDRYEAKQIHVGTDVDISVLKIEPKEPLTTLKLGTASQVQIGDRVITIGYPLPTLLVSAGVAPEATISAGSVSGHRKSLTGSMYGAREAIQHDARMTHGNSGGPLLDSKTGEVVGLNTWAAWSGGAPDSLNMSIPADAVFAVLANLGLNLRDRGQLNGAATGRSATLNDLYVISKSKELPSAWIGRTPFEPTFSPFQNNLGLYRAATGRIPSLASSPIVVGQNTWLTTAVGQILRSYDSVGQRAVETIVNDETQAFFDSPVASGSTVYAWSGELAYGVNIVARTDIGSLLFGGGMRSKATISGQGTLFALDDRSKALKWSKELLFCSSVAPIQDRVYFGGLGGYGALDPSTGEAIWSQGKSNKDEEHPRWYFIAGEVANGILLLEVPLRVSDKPEDTEGDDRIAVFGNGMAKLLVIDPATGKSISTLNVAKIDDFRRALNASAKVTDGGKTAYCVVGPYLFRVDLASQKIVWQSSTASKTEIQKNRGRDVAVYDPAIVESSEMIYVGCGEPSGAMFALDKATGEEKWSFRTRGSTGAPFVNQDSLYFGTSEARIYCMDRMTGQLRWKIKTHNGVTTRPIVDGRFLTFSPSRAFYLMRLFLPPGANQ